jgi:hypothetical protein
MPVTSAPSTTRRPSGGDEVDRDEVAVGGRALDVVEGAEALAQRLDLLLDVLVGHLDVVDLGLEAVVVRQRDLGLDVDLGGELERLVVLELGDLDLRLGQRLEVVLLQRLDVLLREDVVDRPRRARRRGRPGGR